MSAPTDPPTETMIPVEPHAKSNIRTYVICATVLAVVVVVGGLVFFQFGGTHATGPVSPSVASEVSSDEAVPAAPLETQPEPKLTLSASDFTVDLKVTDKECFGSAGCDITADPSVNYNGVEADLDGVSFGITYEVTGDTSGTQIHTIDCTGLQCTIDDVTAQTASSAIKLKAHVTEVDVQ